MSQQDQTSPPPASQAPSAPVAPTPKPPAASGFWSRFTIPLFAVLAAFVFIALATLRWDAWVGSATVQTTNDAYVRAELTRLSSRVAGEVITVAVQDFQRVKAGDLLVQIDPADYAAQVAQAEAGVAAAQAALDNLSNQVELQYATIAQAEAQLVSAAAHEVEASGAGAPAVVVADRIRNAPKARTGDRGVCQGAGRRACEPRRHRRATSPA